MSYLISTGLGTLYTSQTDANDGTELSYTIDDNVAHWEVNASATIPSYTLTLPSVAYATGQLLIITFGGFSLTNNKVALVLNIAAPAGMTINNNGLTPVTAETNDVLIYGRVGTVWKRVA